MKQIEITQLDDLGYFVGLGMADESPLQPGVYLVPAGAIVGAPVPKPPAGKRARWSGTRWVYDLIPVEPPPPAPDPNAVPQVVSKFQARAALAQFGKLAEIDAYMQALPADSLARLAWDFAAEYRRQSPTIAGLAALLNLTDAEIDALFRLADTIEA